MRNPHEVLIKPVVSEKSTDLMAQNKYTFQVDPQANKIEIKHAVETIFKVDVTEVRTMNVNGKLKRQGRFTGYTPNWKKAVVTIKEGQRIPIFEE
ncbi:MAG TPA: 50S ribosomal protein L23 [Peptococcaceae bacterium]|jgi:large subunit ribosomal protein L23|nr:50S ribosomal protein L23 [Clostridia bacterium]HOB82173.1 50S ribosomal protein L23 [Peptococcaceae bacterium]HPZ71975.1 50S ribosomal protein L23 [Peptococcaceae bacterium]HQD53970.1 50S ribosomal protein L23 [Peptococcaceae bacterium]